MTLSEEAKQLRARAQAAEALVGELREALDYAKKEHEARGAYQLCYTPEPSAETERLKLRLEEARHNATIYRTDALAKTPADMGGCPHSCVDGGEHAKVCAELARLREQIAEDVGVKTVNQMLRQQLTEAENQALGGQDLVDSLRARVAELEAELGDSRLSGSLIAKECGEAQARVAELEQAERVAHYERNDAKQSLGIALDDLAERDAELARLREMHLGQFTNLEQAMEERDVLRARVAELERDKGAELARLREENANLRMENGMIEFYRLKEANDALNARVFELTDEHTELAGKRDIACHRNEVLAARVAELERDNARLQMELDAAMKEESE
jgi:hypothetical protein